MGFFAIYRQNISKATLQSTINVTRFLNTIIMVAILNNEKFLSLSI